MDHWAASLHDAAMSADGTTGFTDINRQHWSLRYLPPWARPYGRLSRWDRPIGTWLLMLPCWWSAALGAAPEWGRLVGWMALFALGALAMRGAGCTWNDIVDRKIDAQVERTRGRPLPSGEIKVTQALSWFGIQLAIGAAVLFKLDKFAGGVALCSLLLVAIYPTMKRLTSWPQVVLGLAFNWGALLGYTAVLGRLEWAAVVLYAGAIAWTIGYDTIYAHQDREDDALLGLKSTALKFGRATKAWLAVFYALAWLGITTAGLLAGAEIVFLLVMAAAGAHLFWQVATLDIDDPDNCLQRFRSNRDFGLIVFAAIVLDLVLASRF